MFFVVTGCLLGCGGGNSNSNPPSGLSYIQPAIVGTVNVAITPDVPTVTGAVTSFGISPALPAGLTLNTSTGTISGTPTAVAAMASYTVTASNAGGFTSAAVKVAVVDTPPTGLSYGQPAITTAVNQAITPDVPEVTGNVTAYTISPSLPAGLSLSSSTGTISGTPTAVTAQTSYTVTASNSSGSTTATIQITVTVPPPTGLSYSQSSISAVVNQPITPDTPTVSGVVTSYSISPSLPDGLSIDPSAGVISGNPGFTAGLSMYTVTASNAGGSTSTALQISVAALPQSPGLAYAQPVINTYVGQEITPDIPGTSGAMSSFIVSPALPAGLSLDPSTGIVSGIPTAEAAKADYTVTGSSSDGSINTANTLTITVNQAPNVLLQLSNDENGLASLQFVNSSILSQDGGGGWILWDYKSGAIIASGDNGLQTEMAGPTLAIGIPGGIQFRASSDGHVLSTIVSPGFDFENGGLVEADSWQLASDGSYVSVETPLGFFVYTPSGQLVFSRTGYYFRQDLSNPIIFAASSQVQVANGPAGPNAIETISVPGGVSTVSPAYQGQFQAWFSDGGRFLTSDSNIDTVWTYSNSGVQQAAISVPGSPDIFSVGGVNNWIWIFGATNLSSNSFLNIYPVGSATPAFVDTDQDMVGYAASGTTLAVFPITVGETVRMLDLSGSTPTENDFAVPMPINHGLPGVESFGVTAGYIGAPTVFAAVSSTQWVAGVNGDLILDGASISGTPRYFGNGAGLDIVGGTNRVAIATGSGQIFYFDPGETTPEGSIGLTSGELEMSSDGSVLAASSQDGSLLNIYSLPSGTVSDSFSYSSQSAQGLLYDFAMSGSGTTIAQIESAAPLSNCPIQITAVSGSPTILSLTNSSSCYVALSPDGTLAAISIVSQGTCGCGPGNIGPSISTAIYQNGQQVTIVAGDEVGWLDNGRLLVMNNFGSSGGEQPVFEGYTIYSPTGTVLATPPFPEGIGSIQPITSDTVYAPNENAIYSLSTGQATWTSPYPTGTSGAISGSYVVFKNQDRVLAIKY